MSSVGRPRIDGRAIVADVGLPAYASTASFTRAFARWEGTSPGRWRRNAKRL